MTNALRPMSTGEVLDRTFNLYRNNFQLFAGIATILSLVNLIGILLVVVMGQGASAVSPDYRNPAAFGTLVLIWFVGYLLFFLIGYALSLGATIYAVSQVHLGNRTTIRECYRRIRPQMWSIVNIVISIFMRIYGAAILAYLGVVLVALAAATTRSVGFVEVAAVCGLVAAFVWALSIVCKYSLAVPACLLEKIKARSFLKLIWWVPVCAVLGLLLSLASKSTSLGGPLVGGALLGLTVVLTLMPKPALQRSKKLAKDSLFRIFIVLLLVIVLYLAFVLGLQYAGGIVLAKMPYVLLGWGLLAAFVGSTLSFPIVNIAFSLLYYDQRIRKEAFDLQLMMEAVGQAPQGQRAAAAPGIG